MVYTYGYPLYTIKLPLIIMASLFSIKVEELSRIPRPVIALIGKREVPESEHKTLINMGRKLAKRLPNAIFRSGNAEGADTMFAEGVRNVDNYLRGDRDRYTVKVSYILRDAWLILGSTTVELPRVDAVIYYDDP